MKHSIIWEYSPAAISAARSVPVGTVAEQSHRLGNDNGEPLLVAMDALLRYASCYAVRFESGLCTDYVLGPVWLKSILALRNLSGNSDGGIALARNITTDSKYNGAMESLFWSAIKISGYEEKDFGNV